MEKKRREKPEKKRRKTAQTLAQPFSHAGPVFPLLSWPSKPRGPAPFSPRARSRAPFPTLAPGHAHTPAQFAPLQPIPVRPKLTAAQSPTQPRPRTPFSPLRLTRWPHLSAPSLLLPFFPRRWPSYAPLRSAVRASPRLPVGRPSSAGAPVSHRAPKPF